VGDGGNTYTKIESAVDVDQTNCIALFICEGITGGTTPTVTVTFDGSYEYRRIIIAEYTGSISPTVNISDILNSTESGSEYVCPAVVTTDDGCRVVAFVADIEDIVDFSASASPSGQTVRVENTVGGGRMAMLDLSQTSAGSITPSFDGDNSGYDYFAATVALTDVVPIVGPFSPPLRGEAFAIQVALEDYWNPGNFKSSPTLAAGDVKVSKDGGALANLATLPSVQPSSRVLVMLELSSTEMDADIVTIKFIDQTNPKEWADLVITIPTQEE
jgi:hypothetical protein